MLIGIYPEARTKVEDIQVQGLLVITYRRLIFLQLHETIGTVGVQEGITHVVHGWSDLECFSIVIDCLLVESSAGSRQSAS